MSDDAPSPGEEREGGAEGKRKRSFWERIGESAGRGVRAAKEIGGRIGNQVGDTLARQRLEDTLRSQYRSLGRLAANRLRDPGDTLSGSDKEVRAMIEDIDRTVAQLEALAQEHQADEGEETK